MKNFTIGLNVFLVVAVAILFYLHFSSTKKSTLTLQANKQEINNNFKIAYFEMDSIENNYEYLKDVRNTLRALEQQKSSELLGLKNANKAKLSDYQKKGNAMTQEEMVKSNDDLMKLDNELKTQEQIKSQELQDESMKKIQAVKKEIEDYLKDFNKDKNYSYILSSSTDIIYLKDSIYNITNDVIKGLNDQYKKKKK